jgi:hypothetical protein
MRVSVAAEVLIRAVSDESVLLNITSKRYLGLDAVGTRIWNCLTTSDSIQNAYETLLSEYEVDPEVLKNDLDQFIHCWSMTWFK